MQTHRPRCVAADRALAPSVPPPSRAWRIGAAWKAAPFLFGSGFCALVYQLAWQREFRLIFGASTAASAAVVAIFMGSLGAGGWVLGRMADRRREPWRFYALEGERVDARLRIAQTLPAEAFCREAIAPLENPVAWNLDFLLYRRNCYDALGDPRAGRARADMEEYIRNDNERGASR